MFNFTDLQKVAFGSIAVITVVSATVGFVLNRKHSKEVEEEYQVALRRVQTHVGIVISILEMNNEHWEIMSEDERIEFVNKDIVEYMDSLESDYNSETMTRLRTDIRKYIAAFIKA